MQNEWKSWGHQFKQEGDSSPALIPARRSATLAMLPGLERFVHESTGTSNATAVSERPKVSYVQMRRDICFLQLLAHRTTKLARILSLPPYNMPPVLLQQVRTLGDESTTDIIVDCLSMCR